MSTPSTPRPADSTDVKETQSSSSAFPASTLEEENRDLRRRLEAMEGMMWSLLHPPAHSISAAPASTPISRSSPAYVPAPEPHRPPASVVRSLEFRQPPPAPVAPNSTTSPHRVEDVQSSFPPSKPRSRKVPAPEKFKGTAQERSTADTWLDSANDWLSLTAEGESEEVLIMMFGTVLEGSAKKWLGNLRKRAERERKQLTLQEVFDAFVRTYAGGLSQKMAEQKLATLVYGKGDCKDLNATDNEFDRLAQELYPGAEDSPAAISLLARIYSDTIRRGDEELWEKAMDAQPSTVDEWKAAAQNAYLVIETKKAHQSRSRADRQEVRSTFHSRSSPSTSTSTSVQVKKVEHDEASRDKPAQEEPRDEEELQKTEVRGTPRSGSRPMSERLGSHLTFKQRAQLTELGKCWICLEKGHRSFECEKKGKSGYPRKPTAEDLKA
jgi:hypothetical protein